MRENELMIGDWVCYDGDVEYNMPVKIEGMDIATGALITSDRDDVGFDGVIPITLTAEILDMNCGHIQSWNGKSVVWTWYNYKEGRSGYIELSKHAEGETCKDGFFFSVNDGEYYLFKITYVHELQHALRLCGIETEVVL